MGKNESHGMNGPKCWMLEWKGFDEGSDGIGVNRIPSLYTVLIKVYCAQSPLGKAHTIAKSSLEITAVSHPYTQSPQKPSTAKYLHTIPISPRHLCSQRDSQKPFLCRCKAPWGIILVWDQNQRSFWRAFQAQWSKQKQGSTSGLSGIWSDCKAVKKHRITFKIFRDLLIKNGDTDDYDR